MAKEYNNGPMALNMRGSGKKVKLVDTVNTITPMEITMKALFSKISHMGKEPLLLKIFTSIQVIGFKAYQVERELINSLREASMREISLLAKNMVSGNSNGKIAATMKVDGLRILMREKVLSAGLTAEHTEGNGKIV